MQAFFGGILETQDSRSGCLDLIWAEGHVVMAEPEDDLAEGLDV